MIVYNKFIIVFFISVILFTGTKLYDPDYQMEKNMEGLHFEKKIIDFGIVPQDTFIVGRYKFFNVSDTTIRIVNVSASCMCTKVNITNHILQPGDSSYIEMYLNTAHKEGYTKIYGVVQCTSYERFHKIILKGIVIK